MCMCKRVGVSECGGGLRAQMCLVGGVCECIWMGCKCLGLIGLE